MKSHVVLRPHPDTAHLGNPRWTLLVDGKDISDAVAHDGFHVDFEHGTPRVVLTLRADTNVELDLPAAEVEVKQQGTQRVWPVPQIGPEETRVV